MVGAGIDIFLPKVDWYYIDNEGEQVERKRDKLDLIIKIETTHPE